MSKRFSLSIKAKTPDGGTSAGLIHLTSYASVTNRIATFQKQGYRLTEVILRDNKFHLFWDLLSVD